MNLIEILNFDLYNLMYLFIIYSFLGWCVEVIYYIKKERKFVNRGFLYGPFCPIYGCGLVSIIVLLNGFKDNIFLLFVSAFFLTSFLEYYTGFILEKIFKSKWWDYTDDAFNLHGRICLLYSIIWGAASVAVIKIIHPSIKNIIDGIPKDMGTVLLYCSITYFIIDFTLTILSLIKLKNILLGIQAEIDAAFTKHGELLFHQKGKAFSSVRTKALETAQALGNVSFKVLENAKLLENPIPKLKLNLNHIRLIKAFPNVSSKSFGYLLKTLKEKLKKD